MSSNALVSLFPVYDVSGAASDRNCVVLSDIHIDIMDYIQPASCTDAEFRQMWAEFEWENKVRLHLLTEQAISLFCGEKVNISNAAGDTYVTHSLTCCKSSTIYSIRVN